MLQKQGFFSTLFLYRTQVNYAAADTIVGVCHRPDGLNITPLIIYQINFQSNSK